MPRLEAPLALPSDCNSDRRAGPAACRTVRRTALLAAAILVCVRAPGAVAKVYANRVQSMDNWYFLDYFVFDTSGKGKVKWDLLVEPGAEGMPIAGTTPTCSECVLTYRGVVVDKGCDFLNSVSSSKVFLRRSISFNTTKSDNKSNSSATTPGPTETTACFMKDVRFEGDQIPCDDWDQKHAISWGSCALRKSSSTQLLFYNDVDGDKANWRDIYSNRAAPGESGADKCSCNCLAARAALSVSIERGIEAMSELPVLKASKPRFWFAALDAAVSLDALMTPDDTVPHSLYAYMYRRTYVYACMHACVYACMYVRLSICLSCLSVCPVCLSVPMYACMYACMYVCMYVHMYVWG